MPNRWLEVSIRASAEAAEALAAVFERHGRGGVVVEPEIVQGHDEDDAAPAPGGFSILRTYLREGDEVPARRTEFEKVVGILRAFELAPMGELQFRWIDEEDWANAWKQHYQVQRIGRHWVVKPRWQAYERRPSDRIIELDPAMAFGTGLHPTTQLVLECLEDLSDAGEVAGEAILDLGTGSGILAIGAARLGAASVLALDVDDVAVSAATQNAAASGAGGVITVQRGTLGAPIDGVESIPGLDLTAAFDGVLANIVTRVIAQRAPVISRALRPGGWLIASGLIVDRAHEAESALEANGLPVGRRLQRGDWITLRCRKTT
ncbi:MAG: 50S ribosomal protein L11 methyltransferase [Chloroflexi bacterium]|nr:50S ribosomal protein L11 methyltransferase [Chloroflexota bacterium]